MSEKKENKKIVICDIDGTISDSRERVKKYLFGGYECKECGKRSREVEVICKEINETCAFCGGKLQGVEKDYVGFYKAVGEDKPMHGIMALVGSLVDNIAGEYYKIVFVTGRSEICRKETEYWLVKHFGNLGFELVMRAEYDRRKSSRVKKDVIKNLFNAEDIAFVFDDEPSVIDMYRKNCPNATIIDVKNYLHNEAGS